MILYLAVNNRLCQFLKTNLLVNELANNSVLITPQVFTWQTFLNQWQQQQHLAGKLDFVDFPSKVLSDFEAQLIWEELLAKKENISLLNSNETAKQLYQAWLYFNEYMSSESLDEVFKTEEFELFLSLKQQYQQRLTELDCWDKILLIQQQLSWFEKLAPVAEEIKLVGFDDVSPYLKKWLALQQNKATKIEFLEQFELAEKPLPPKLFGAKSEQQEAQQAAAWAYDLAYQQGLKSIAIVAPDVAEVSENLIWALDELMWKNKQFPLPSHQQNWQDSPFYNVSLGQPLLNYPLIKQAFSSLKIMFSNQRSVEFEVFSNWLISPYNLGDLIQRQKLDFKLRRWQWTKISIDKVLAKMSKEDCKESFSAELSLSIVDSLEQISQQQKKLTAIVFIEQLLNLLSTLKWATGVGKRSLDSQEYQQQQAFIKALNLFKSYQFSKEKQSFLNWLALLERFVAEQIFQPKNVGESPIQIMGLLEAGGQQFDAIWIMGMSIESWPREAHPNPFLPMNLQREKGVPRADSARELHYAKTLSRRLAKSAKQVVWSYSTKANDGRELLLSPVVELLINETLDFNSTVEKYIEQPFSCLARQSLASAKPVEWVEDNKAPALEKGAKVPGGTEFLTAQAACPLMAFFDYRLGARNRLESVEEGVEKNHTGILIHRVLERFWQKVVSHQALMANTTKNQQLLQNIIDEEMALVGNQYQADFLKQESLRIYNLLLEWLELEKKRPAFQVVGFETNYQLTLASLLFNVKIDRVDKVASGNVIIDYKTGKASIAELSKYPIEKPQLAIYLTAPIEQVVGLGYGLIHADEKPKFFALVQEEDVLLKDRNVKLFSSLSDKEDQPFYELDWQAGLEYLTSQVEELALSIQQGDARLKINDEVAMSYSNSLLALRLPEAKEQL